MAGILYVVATPIGNLEDISARALQVLRRARLIACEDTRVTGKLLARYGIRTRTVSYHEHNERRRAVELAERLRAGEDIALTSDAGTPGLSDPGYRLVHEARRQGISVMTIPGPSAAVAALAVSGLPTSSFCFYGFLPAKPAARRKAVDSIEASPHTAVVFESARRMPRLLVELAERLGPRPAFLAREMTKAHEEHQTGSLAELALWARRQGPLRGELTLVVAGRARISRQGACGQGAAGNLQEPEVLLYERFQELASSGLARREAVKTLARECNLPSREVYRQILRRQRSP